MGIEDLEKRIKAIEVAIGEFIRAYQERCQHELNYDDYKCAKCVSGDANEDA